MITLRNGSSPVISRSIQINLDPAASFAMISVFITLLQRRRIADTPESLRPRSTFLTATPASNAASNIRHQSAYRYNPPTSLVSSFYDAAAPA